MRTLLLFRRGQRRAADRIAALEADLNQAHADLVHADAVLSRYAAQRVQDAESIANLTAERDTHAAAHDELLGAYDELFARYREVKACNENLTAVRVPAIADDEPTIRMRYEAPVTDDSTLWDGHNTIRVADVRSLIVLNKHAKAAA